MPGIEARWASMRTAGAIPAGIERIAEACHWHVRWKKGQPVVAPEECFADSRKLRSSP